MDLQFEPKKEESIFIRITEKTKEHLDKLAREHNTNRSEIARKLILDSLKRQED